MAEDLVQPAQPTNPANLPNPQKMSTEDHFDQFMFIVWMTNPIRDNVRIILDDGSIKMYLKRDRFEKLMTDIMNKTLLQSHQYTLFRIRESLKVYGGVFYYDRVQNIFRELQENIDLERIRPNELIMESRKSAVKEMLQTNFENAHREYSEDVIDKFKYEKPKSMWNKFETVIRQITTKKKKPRF